MRFIGEFWAIFEITTAYFIDLAMTDGNNRRNPLTRADIKNPQ